MIRKYHLVIAGGLDTSQTLCGSQHRVLVDKTVFPMWPVCMRNATKWSIKYIEISRVLPAPHWDLHGFLTLACLLQIENYFWSHLRVFSTAKTMQTL